jgi:hypothetical protein
MNQRSLINRHLASRSSTAEGASRHRVQNGQVRKRVGARAFPGSHRVPLRGECRKHLAVIVGSWLLRAGDGSRPGGCLLNRALRFGSRLVIAALLVGLTACKTTRQVSDVETSGFLTDYGTLNKGTNDQAALVYINPAANWNKYTKIWLKPIELWKSDDPDSAIGKFDEEDQKELVSMFHQAMVDQLQKDYQLVEQGGPDVLIIRSALTDAKKSKPVLNFVSSVYLPLKLVSFGKRLATGTDIAVGNVTIEAEFLDGESNQRLAAVVDQRAGTKALRTKFEGRWGDVNLAFEWWAQRLATRLAEEKAGTPEKTEI